MDGNTMALGKRNNGNFRLSSVEVGAPRIWIHLNRIRKKQLEEKTGREKTVKQKSKRRYALVTILSSKSNKY